MHNGVCVSTPCVCKSMHTQAKKDAEAAFVKEQTEVIRPMIENDIVALLSSQEELLVYEHFFYKGMEYASAKKQSEIEELKIQLEWKEQQIQMFLEDRKNNYPF